MANEFTDANFKEQVLNSEKLSVIDFWAEWCGPCRAISPVIEELAKEYDGKVNIGKVNVDHNPQISMDYGITSIPAILFVKGGQVVDIPDFTNGKWKTRKPVFGMTDEF